MAIQREIWLRTIVEGLFADNTFASKAMNDDAYVNQGKTVHIPNAGAPSAVTKNRSTVPASVSKRTDVDVTYDLDEYTTDPILIPHADTVQFSYNKRNSVISQDRAALIDNVHEGLLVAWAPASTSFIRTTGGAVDAHTPSATGSRKAFTSADLLTAMTKMNADNVPLTERYALLDAQMYSELLAFITETDKIGFFAAADVKRGIVGSLYGFEVMVRSRVLVYATAGTVKEWTTAGAATDNAAALVWQRNSLSRAIGEVKMFDSTDNPTYYGDIYSFLVRCGGAIRRNDKKGVYAIVQDTAV